MKEKILHKIGIKSVNTSVRLPKGKAVRQLTLKCLHLNKLCKYLLVFGRMSLSLRKKQQLSYYREVAGILAEATVGW